jgi:hypothetical protein
MMRGDTWLGIFSTRKTSLGLQSGFDDAVVAPLQVPGFMNGPEISAGAGGGRLQYGAETWTLAYARSRWTAPLASAVEARRDDDGTLHLASTLPFDLQDTALLIGGEDRAVLGWIKLGPLPSGGSVTVPPDPAAAVPLPDTDLELDDLAWAVSTFHAPVVDGRASLGVAGTPLTLVGVASRGLEPIELTGLSPIDQPLLVVRQPLPTGLSVQTELNPGSLVLEIEPGLQVWTAEVVCGTVRRMRNNPSGSVRFDGLLGNLGRCELSISSDKGYTTVEVRVEDDPVVWCEPSGADTVKCTVEAR